MDDSSVRHEATRAQDFGELRVTSAAFLEGALIPPEYTCDGRNISPPIDIEHVPADARSLALIADDPDAPHGTWLHWMVWDIPVTHGIPENEIHGTAGKNDFGDPGYGGPCPPSGTHRYCFRVYALDAVLNLPADTRKAELERSMAGHILAFGQLTGRYRRA
ncbi:MAG TPA: YbhB/YbcL family Raf kinase inhibitor-like protein [Sphingobacteriaceae bacterium]